jgi:xylulokinase
MDYVVGCDVGSQGVKAVLLSVEGQLVGEASAGYAIEYPHPTWAEQSAEVWLTAIAQAVGALRATTGVAPDHIRAIGLDAQVDGVVAVDAAGKPLRPAIIWMDRRAVPQCAAVANAADPIHLFQLSGLNLDPSHVAPKIRWLAENEPDHFEQAAHFLLPGSYEDYYQLYRSAYFALLPVFAQAARLPAP